VTAFNRTHGIGISLVLAFTLASPASAQVNRCKDAGGKIIYSDKPCDTGQTGRQIERQRTQAEIYQERDQAYNAEVRKQQRNMAEQQREWEDQSRRAPQYQQAPVVRHSGNDWAQRKALENAATSAKSIANSGGKWDRAAEAERAREREEESRRRASQDPQPANITNCMKNSCYDDQGGVHNSGGKNFMTGPNGQTCRRSGNFWNCN
jgi:hypothetical protein